METHLSRSDVLAGPGMMRAIFVLLALLPVTANAGMPDLERGRVLYGKTCVTCHDDSASQERLQGPPLFGVVGRKVGSAKGFGYSDALKRANAVGKTWTEAELDVYLADPDKTMPGGYMPLAVPEKTERLNLIAYLKTLVEKKP
jgi:cytochrome c